MTTNQRNAGNWLAEELQSASKEVAEWPRWMQEQARFVGGKKTEDNPELARTGIRQEPQSG